jgi:hypothetical protein
VRPEGLGTVLFEKLGDDIDVGGINVKNINYIWGYANRKSLTTTAIRYHRMPPHPNWIW